MLGIAPGARIALTVDDLETLGAAFFTELEKRFPRGRLTILIA